MTVKSPVVFIVFFLVIYSRCVALSGISLGNFSWGVDRGSCLINTLISRLVGIMYSPYVWNVGLCFPTIWKFLYMSVSASMMD